MDMERVDIVSGNFPGYSTGYPNCVVEVEAPEGQRVYANFLATEFGATDNAIVITSDNHTFDNANGTGFAVVDRNEEYPLDIVSIGNRLVFNFTSYNETAEYRISIQVSVLNESIIQNGKYILFSPTFDICTLLFYVAQKLPVIMSSKIGMIFM